jgi:hypothetical protein
MLVAGSPLFELNAKAGMLAAAGVLFWAMLWWLNEGQLF